MPLKDAIDIWEENIPQETKTNLLTDFLPKTKTPATNTELEKTAINIWEKETAPQEKNVIPEIRAMRPEERRYVRPLSEEEKAQSVVDFFFKERGEKTPFGLRALRKIESPEAQAITQTALVPELTILQGIRGAIDRTGGYDLVNRIQRGILESENTKRFYEYLPKTETLPNWAKITASIGEDIISLGALGLGRVALKKELLTRNINRRIDQAAEQFATENMSRFMPTANQAQADLVKADLKNAFKNEFLARATAPTIEGARVESIGQFTGEIKPSILQEYANRKSLLGLIGEELKAAGTKGQALIPKFKAGDVVKLKKGSFEFGKINADVLGIEGDKAILDVVGKQIPVALSKLELVKAKEEEQLKQISVFKQPLNQYGYVMNLIYKNKPIPKDLFPVLADMISEQRTQMGESIFEPDNDIDKMLELAEKGKLKIHFAEDFFSKETLEEFYPPEEYAKVKDYAQLQEGAGIELRDERGNALNSGDVVKYERNKVGILEDVFDNGIAQIKTPSGIEEKEIYKLRQVDKANLTKEEKSAIDSIGRKAAIGQLLETAKPIGKGEPSVISRDNLTPDIVDKLFYSEKQIVTKRVLEGKSVKQTAKELDWSVEDVIKEEKYVAQRIGEIPGELAEVQAKSDAELAEGFEKELSAEALAVKSQLKNYFSEKLKPELKQLGEYEDLKNLDWLFAKPGEVSFTPDQLAGELQGMGFNVETDDDIRELIKNYFKEEIWDKADRELAKIDRQAKAKLKSGLSQPTRKKIEEEMRLGKLRVIADQLSKLAEVAPRLITPKQIAYMHVLKTKNMLTDEQFARLKKIYTGKESLAVTTPTGRLKKEPTTKEEAQGFIGALEKGFVPRKPVMTGQPPIIPTTKALVPSQWSGPFNDLTTFQATPLSGLDPIRAAELVDGKPYGTVRQYIVEPTRNAEREAKLALKETLDALTKISKGMKKKSKSSELTFKYVEKTLSPEEEKLITDDIRDTADYMRRAYDELLEKINKARSLLDKIPIQKRQDYITHIQELSLLDEFYQGLSNVADDAINIPPFAKSNSPFFRFALQRLGGEEFKLDAIDAFETYISKAYPVIHNTEVLKTARPLVDRLPPNAYKYFSQYLDETMALRPTRADQLIPRPILNGVSWLRQTMGKGAILGNFASFFNQLFTTPNTMSAVGPKFFASAFLKMHKSEWRSFIEAHSKVLQGRIYEIDFDPTLLSKTDKALGFLIQFMDKEMVRIAWGAQFEKSLSKGASFEQAIREADDIAFKTQSGFNLTDLPPAFRSKIAASFLQFQNTVNNGLNYLRFDLGKEGAERGKWGVFKAALMWIGTLLVTNFVYRQFGIPSAVEEWTDIFPLASLAEYGTPATFSLPTAIVQRIVAKTPQDQAAANRALYKAAYLFLPAGNQIRKTLEGIYSISKGGKFDKRGRLQFPIRGIPEQTRAVLFGPFGTIAGREYIKRGFKPDAGAALDVWNKTKKGEKRDVLNTLTIWNK